MTAASAMVQAQPRAAAWQGSWFRAVQGVAEGTAGLLSPILQFQGQWFVLGLASNTYGRGDRALLNTFSVTFRLNKKGHFEVSNTMTR